MNEPQFTTNSNTSRDVIKRHILVKNLIRYQCDECQITDTYNNKKIVLHLDHINGIRNDNRLENLRFLCPNCHSQTDTYCGKSKNKRGNNQCSCGSTKFYYANRCNKCESKRRLGTRTKIIWPPIEELKDRISKSSYLAVSRELGVTDNAIRHHILRRE